MYYVVYKVGIGYHLYSEKEMKSVNISDDCIVEFYGYKSECEEYIRDNK